MCARQMTRRTGLSQRSGEPGGLRVVEDHDVAGPHERHELTRCRRGDRLVLGSFGVAQRATVPWAAVQPVVQSLG